MQLVTKNMAGIVKSLEKSMEANNLEKIAATMSQFERQFENLDLQTQVVDEVMGAQANLSTPEEDVNSLIQQVGVGVVAVLGWGWGWAAAAAGCGAGLGVFVAATRGSRAHRAGSHGCRLIQHAALMRPEHAHDDWHMAG